LVGTLTIDANLNSHQPNYLRAARRKTAKAKLRGPRDSEGFAQLASNPMRKTPPLPPPSPGFSTRVAHD
jgi:hypothetical protein